MCTIAAGIGLTLAQGIMSYDQQRKQAAAQSASLQAQADAAAMQQQQYQNAANAEAHKQSQIADQYAQKASALRDQHRKSSSAAIAQAGAAGLNLSGGTSAMDILTAGQEAYNTDQANLLTNQRNDNYNSRVTQSGFENQANASAAQSHNLHAQAEAVKDISPWPTILSTATQIYGLTATAGANKASSAASNTTAPSSNGFYDFSYNSNNAFGKQFNKNMKTYYYF